MKYFATALFIALLILTLAHYLTITQAFKAMGARANSYLCLRGLVAKTTGQLTTQKRFNQAITALNAAIVLAIMKPPLQATLLQQKKLAVKLSQVSYAAFLKDLAILKRCPLRARFAVLNTPFKSQGLLLVRSSGGLAQYQKNWSFSLPGRGFTLRGRLRNREHLQWDIREIAEGIFGLRP